jgi:hypothetical protein
MRRRALAAGALLPLAVGPIAWASANSRPPSRPLTELPSALERETACPGVWRWPVKVLADKPANSSLPWVSFYSRLKTVAELGALPKPTVTINSRSVLVPRQPGPERKTYRVEAELVKMVKERDGDIHLVIADPGPDGKRMVAEFPSAICTPASTSPKLPQMEAARRTLTDHCGLPPSRFKNGILDGTATVKGVGFFDYPHAGDQAENGIELHPVIGLTKVVCKRVPVE